MSKSDLVKIGIPAQQAESMRLMRRIRQILDHHDAAVARLTLTTNERIREAMSGETHEAEEPATATA
jgi:hypothetical protein